MSYHKKSRLVAGIILTCSFIIIGLLFVVNTVVFRLIGRSEQQKSNTVDIVAEESLSGIAATSTETLEDDSGISSIKKFINRALGIIGLLAIPATIVGIILLATYKPKAREIVDEEGMV